MRISRAAWFVAWAVAVLFLWKMVRVTWLHAASTAGIDFYFFWDAASQTLRGNATQLYATHPSPVGEMPPLGYPPPVLLLIAPLGLFDYGPALFLWLGFTGMAYAVAARQPARLVLSNPSAGYNALFGQTGFLTSALFVGGVGSADKRPLVGGVLLGCMVVKPQLALLLPLALAAAQNWRALSVAATTATMLVLVGVLAFGPAIYALWWASLAQYGDWLQTGRWVWPMLASPYGVFRWCGMNNAGALACQALIALGAAFVVVTSWRNDWRSKSSVLAAATLLVSPYLFAYDAVLMIVPLGYLARGAKWRAVVVWLLLLVPLLGTSFFSSAYLPFDTSGFPNTTPLAAALTLFFLCKDQVSDRTK